MGGDRPAFCWRRRRLASRCNFGMAWCIRGQLSLLGVAVIASLGGITETGYAQNGKAIAENGRLCPCRPDGFAPRLSPVGQLGKWALDFAVLFVSCSDRQRDDRHAGRFLVGATGCSWLRSPLSLGWAPWVLIAGATPRIDVWQAQTAGMNAAVHGSDPWSSSFPHIYHHPTLYAPGTESGDGRTYLGFPYPPLTLLMQDLPGHLLAGDYRWDNLLAMALTAVLIAKIWPGTMGRAVALLFFTPRAILGACNGWTEPTIILLMAATVLSAAKDALHGRPG